MMKWVFGILILLSLVCGLFTGQLDKVSKAVFEEGSNAVELCIFLAGSMCVWGGIMRVAEASGLTALISKVLSPIGKFLFKGLDTSGRAFSAIVLNVTANLLGLGNAATPLGLEAMKALEREEKPKNGRATDNMIVFILLNTASITIIPTTVAALRLAHGSNTPLDILPLVIINAVFALAVSLSLCMVLNKSSAGR